MSDSHGAWSALVEEHPEHKLIGVLAGIDEERLNDKTC